MTFRQHSGLVLLLIAFVLLAWLFSITIPLSKAPDEYVHFLYVRFLAEHGHPPLTLPERAEAGYKSDQPPLYHSIVALFTAPVDVSESPSFKFSWEPASRQLIDLVLPRALLVRTEDETWPYYGLFLAWFVGRWISILLSGLTLFITYIISLEIFPKQRWLALGVAGTLAFMPRYIFISSVLNDDNLIGLLMALFLWAVIRLVKYPARSGWPIFAGVGAVIGLALITKYSVALVPLEFTLITIWLFRKQGYAWRHWLTRLATTGLVAAIIVTIWLGFILLNFNQVKQYGPILGIINPLIAGDTSDDTSALISGLLTGDEDLAADIDPGQDKGNIVNWATKFFEQFWDVPVFGATRLYPVLFVTVPALMLVILAIGGWWRRWQNNEPQQRMWLTLLLLHVFTFLPLPLFRFFLTGQIHDTAQARHVLFPAAPAIAILLTVGLISVFPATWQKSVGFALAGAMFLLSIVHLYYYTFAFPPPLPVRSYPAPVSRPDNSLSVGFADGVRLTGYDWQVVQPVGESQVSVLDLNLYWRSTALLTEDYRTELTILDNTGLPQLRWLGHPAQGRFPTRAWDVGDSVRDSLQIPLAGLPAGEYGVELRLLDWRDRPVPSTVGDEVRLMTFTLGQLSAPETPMLWQSGRPANHLPAYRYRATIPVTVPKEVQAGLTGPGNRAFTPQVSLGQLALFMVDHTWPSGQYRVQLDGVDTDLALRVENFDTRPGGWDFTLPDMMHTVNANFNAELRLLGYDLPTRRVEAGDGVPLVLYWQSLRRMAKSYIIFDRLLDSDGRSWGGYDRLPKETYPTNLWVPGEVVADGFAVPVEPATPAGVYNIVIGLYDEADPTAQSLPLFEAGQPVEASSITIGPIKVGGPPPGATLPEQTVSPRTGLSVELGEPPVVLLRGHDLAQDKGVLEITLYWESLSQTAIDWSTFVHLRDEAGETVAQKDGPTGGGLYPTSLWDPGEIIADELIVPIGDLSPREYTVVIGLYDVSTGLRLAVPDDPANELLLDDKVKLDDEPSGKEFDDQ